MRYEQIIVLLALMAVIITILLRVLKLRRSISEKKKIKNEILEFSNKVVQLESPEKVYDLLMDTVMESVKIADRGTLMILEEGEFSYKSIRGYGEELKDVHIGYYDTYLYKLNGYEKTQVIKNPRNFSSKKYSNPDSFRKATNEFTLYSTICAPIKFSGVVHGMVNVDSSSLMKRFNKSHLRYVNYLVGEMSLVLMNFEVDKILMEQVNRDELTVLLNRKGFLEKFERELYRVERYKSKCSVVLLDIDNLKSINDTYGHKKGDEAILTISDYLKKNTRNSDIVARLSGDEFAIVFIGLSEIEARTKMLRVRTAITENKIKNYRVSFSFGVAQVDFNLKGDAEQILNTADMDMYKDKLTKAARLQGESPGGVINV